VRDQELAKMTGNGEGRLIRRVCLKILRFYPNHTAVRAVDICDEQRVRLPPIRLQREMPKKLIESKREPSSVAREITYRTLHMTLIVFSRVHVATGIRFQQAA